MSDDQLTADDRALLDQIAHRARHDQDIQDLRDHHAELRARQANRTD